MSQLFFREHQWNYALKLKVDYAAYKPFCVKGKLIKSETDKSSANYGFG